VAPRAGDGAQAQADARLPPQGRRRDRDRQHRLVGGAAAQDNGFTSGAAAEPPVSEGG